MRLVERLHQVSFDLDRQTVVFLRLKCDTAGNRGWKIIGATTTNFTFNNVNELQTRKVGTAPPTTYAYDANGCLINDGTRTFGWDGAQRLVEIQEGTNRVEFVYDGIGRRIKRISKQGSTVVREQRYIWCGAEICWERTTIPGVNPITKRFFSQGVKTNSTVNYYTRDHLGSVREVTDSNGNVVSRYDYDPWGRQTVVTGTTVFDIGYAGYWNLHSTGSILNLKLNLTWYRAYSPELGRWLSRDPIGEIGWMVSIQNLMGTFADVPNSPESFISASSELGGNSGRVTDETNLYTYVLNNPVNLIDPLGLKPWYGNWCGPGPKRGEKPPTKDALDECCKEHDGCYEGSTPPAGGLCGVLAPRTEQCDLTLCRCAKIAKCKGFKCKVARFFVRVIFCTAGKIK